MKILFDMNNLAMRLIHLPMIEAASESPKWEFWKYLIFQNIYEFILDQSEDLAEGETLDVILAVDNKEGSWRHEVYPPYKGNRVKDQSFDWEQIYLHYNLFLADLATYTPWKVLQVPRAEADDVIAAICLSTEERCIIHSGDSDYLQLVSSHVDVFVPHRDEFVVFPCEVKIANTKVVCADAEEFITLSVLTGQGRKDNVFNVKTPTNWFEANPDKRMTPFGIKAAQKAIDDGLAASLEKLGCTENYERNRLLIDFRRIPEDVFGAVLDAGTAYTLPEVNIPEFFSRYNWPSLQGNAGEVQDVLCILAGVENSCLLCFDEEEEAEDETLEQSEENFVI